MVLLNSVPAREAGERIMTDTKKPSRTKDSSKKIISLTLDPLLVSRIDIYATDRGISRSSAIETVLTGFLAPNSSPSMTIPDNSLVQPDNCLFASPQLGTAIYY
jgi:hypothetical protein